jgi:hypothetical protein
MGVTSVLADLLHAGVRLDFTDPEKPTFRVLPEHRSVVAALLTPATKAQTRYILGQIADYRGALLQIFALMAEGATADPAACRKAVQEEMRLHDDLGPRLAGLIRSETVGEYEAVTGRCAYCGGIGHGRVAGDTW